MLIPKVIYSEDYYVDIGLHVFPTEKYRLIREKLIAEAGVKEADFLAPKPAEDSDILLVHTKEYLGKLKNGKLSSLEMMRMEIPYSKELAKASLLCVGGTIEACKIALREGTGIHLGGGFHHAFPDHGEGFCVFNDVAVGIKRSIKDGDIKKAMVIDCDLHQGNGTAAIFGGDNSVFTFSIHQENNYPFIKPKSDIDIGLRDRTKDREYLNYLEEHIPKIISSFKPELILYVAGADPYKDDQIGNLALSIEGLAKRDKFIFQIARNYHVPIATVLAGGYAFKKFDTVQIHYNTITTALKIS